ncbi:hypothetical protein Bbelb_352320 [Branchiostoma belcheri]|nr:hypothetical protein Bbelb_352320 [Branchiostoma belcheri]
MSVDSRPHRDELWASYARAGNELCDLKNRRRLVADVKNTFRVSASFGRLQKIAGDPENSRDARRNIGRTTASLSGVAKARYEDKVAIIGFDPHSLEKSAFQTDLALVPMVEYPDIINYLVLSTSWGTNEQMNAYKSMEAYKFFVSGWVDILYTKTVSPDKIQLFQHGTIMAASTSTGRTSKESWGVSLRPVPPISHTFIEKWARKDQKVPQKLLKKGYAFFSGSYIHNVEVKPGSPVVMVRAKCFPSMRKHDEPKRLEMTISSDLEVDCACSCTAGKGTCNHSVALLYQLAHFQNLGLERVPPIASKTSAPQQWHIPPRTRGVKPAAISKMRLVKTDVPKLCEQPPKKRRTVTAQSQTNDAVITIGNAPDRPKCPCPPLVQEYDTMSLSEDLQSAYQSVMCSTAESDDYEASTRAQSECPEWTKLRSVRLTASKFKDVCSRQKDFQSLAQRFQRKTVRTSAMERGLQLEPTAANVYAQH